MIENGVCPGLIKADNGFDFWQGTPDELIGQIDASWPAAGIPTLATGHCWFAMRSHFDTSGKNLFHHRPDMTKEGLAKFMRELLGDNKQDDRVAELLTGMKRFLLAHKTLTRLDPDNSALQNKYSGEDFFSGAAADDIEAVSNQIRKRNS